MTKRSLLTTIFCALFSLFFSASAQTFSAAERGVAVFYADYLEGQATAYGEFYQRDQMTAAHRSHPAGTLLKVTRLDNQRSVIVRVNDRAELCRGCVVSVSKVAALQLDLLKTGTAMVAVEVVGRKDAPAGTQVVRNATAYNQAASGQTTTNRHTVYPRPDAGFQYGSTYQAPANAYQAEQPVSYDNSTNLQARSPVSYDQPVVVNNNNYVSGNNQQAKGLNGYEQINAFDSYNYYEAQAAKQRLQQQGSSSPSEYGNTTVRSDKATYERLRARGLLPEEKVQNNDASFYARGNIQQPSNYEQNSEPAVNAKGVPNPSAYIQWSNTPTSTAAPASYSAESSFPQTYAVKSPDATGRYAVQLACYRNLDNAQRQLKAVQGKGLATAYLQETPSNSGTLYKLLNGPFNNKETAETQLDHYKRNLLLDGIVVLLK